RNMLTRAIRPTARSGSIVARVPGDLADELHEAGGDPDQQEDQVEEMRPEGFVEQVADDVADHGRHRKHESERGVLADHRHQGLLLFHARGAANSAASWTSGPILGWLGSMSTCTP